MVNTKGIIQNNESTNALLKELKSSNKQYKSLSYQKEREIIEGAASLERDENGMPIIDHIDPKTNKITYRYTVSPEYDNVKELLVLHHIRRVFNLSKKYAQSTRDFDNMIAKGLYGLVVAADRFNPFTPIQRKGSEEVSVWEDDGKTPKFVKFITHATFWILKYIRDEFNDHKHAMIDNHSMSMDSAPRIHNSTDNNQSLSNYVETMLAPGYEHGKTIDNEISANDMSNLYRNIYDYVISDESQLSSMEKRIFVETFYNHKKTSEIADQLNSNTTTIINKRKKVMSVIRKMLSEKMNIHSVYDVVM